MNVQSAADAYRKGAIENAPPLQIVQMLYKGALGFLQRAGRLDPAAEGVEFNNCLGRAEAIVTELRCCLRHEVAPELTKDLDALYVFVEGQIAEASIKRTTEPVENSVQVLSTLLNAWSSVDVQGIDNAH